MSLRIPTPLDVQLAWYRAALAGGRKAYNGGGNEVPECGWFSKHGRPLTAARIWLEQTIDPETGELMADEVLRCQVNGVMRDPEREWPYLCGNPIPEAEYDYLIATQYWAAWHDGRDPAANPHKPVDWLKSSVRF